MRNRLAICVALLAIFSAVARAQTRSAVTAGSVQGRVTCNDGGFPARGARVDLWPLASLMVDKSGSQGPSQGTQQQLGTTTDLDGNYAVSSVFPGLYVIGVRLPGYSQDFDLVHQVLNRFTPEKRKELLAPFPQVVVHGGSAARQDVVVRRGAAITGRVIFDSGGALNGGLVTAALTSSNLIGGPENGDASKPAYFWSARGTTDDRGTYRIAGLPEGNYRIEVHVYENASNTGTGMLTVFAPEALTEVDAKLIAVGDGDELTDVDISIPLRLLHSISGTVTRSGIPIAGASLTIQRQGQTETKEFASSSDGTYRIDMIVSGTYVIEAQYPPAGVEGRGPSVRSKVSVLLGDSDVPDANLDLRR